LLLLSATLLESLLQLRSFEWVCFGVQTPQLTLGDKLEFQPMTMLGDQAGQIHGFAHSLAQIIPRLWVLPIEPWGVWLQLSNPSFEDLHLDEASGDAKNCIELVCLSLKSIRTHINHVSTLVASKVVILSDRPYCFAH
jgi:hypothetical protein